MHSKHIKKSLAVAVLTAAALGTSGVAIASEGNADHVPCSGYGCAAEDDLLDVKIGDVHATQPSLGHDEVYYKLGRYTLGKDEVNKKFDDWCETNGQGEVSEADDDSTLTNPESFECELAVGEETEDSLAEMKTVVIGPGEKPYLVDGHHTLTAFHELPDGGADLHLRLRVLDNLSDLSAEDFWKQMRDNNWVWLNDVDGNPIDVDQLPDSVGLSNFDDDALRSLLYFGRDIGYESADVPFQEFYWGSWLRDGSDVDLGDWDAGDHDSYLAAVEKVTTAQTELDPDTEISDGRTAEDLGALGEWDADEFDKLSKPFSDDKPGKIAYALEYKSTL